jgi:hypothetical protein
MTKLRWNEGYDEYGSRINETKSDENRAQYWLQGIGRSCPNPEYSEWHQKSAHVYMIREGSDLLVSNEMSVLLVLTTQPSWETEVEHATHDQRHYCQIGIENC